MPRGDRRKLRRWYSHYHYHPHPEVVTAPFISQIGDSKPMAHLALPARELKAQRKPLKPRVTRAHEKSVQDRLSAARLTGDGSWLSSEAMTLADRFHALPGELRNHIFALIIVQPVKWDLEHNPDCPRRTSDKDLTPKIPGCRWDEPINCATAATTCQYRWRRDTAYGIQPWMSPWRSQWAPAPKNPYLCSVCYDTRIRPTFEPVPLVKSLPCLCARRQNLQVLLVCKKWYEEAAYIFYTRNTFAFEDSSTLLAFSANVPPHWKRLINKLNVAAWVPVDISWESSSDYLEPKAQLAPIWSALQTYPSLSTLELAAIYLYDQASVQAMLRLGLRNLRRLCFVRGPPNPHPPSNPISDLREGTPAIWPQYAERKLLQGGFAEEVARAIKGERQKRLKGPMGRYLIGEAITEARVREARLMRNLETQ